jgi:hypothetical protein
MRDLKARLHVERVETHIDLVVLFDEWMKRLTHEAQTIRGLMLALSPDTNKAG